MKTLSTIATAPTQPTPAGSSRVESRAGQRCHSSTDWSAIRNQFTSVRCKNTKVNVQSSTELHGGKDGPVRGRSRVSPESSRPSSQASSLASTIGGSISVIDCTEGRGVGNHAGSPVSDMLTIFEVFEKHSLANV